MINHTYVKLGKIYQNTFILFIENMTTDKRNDWIDKIFRAVRNELANLWLDYMTPNSVATVVKQIIKSNLPKQIDREKIEAVEKLREKYVKIKQSAISNWWEAVLDIVIKDIDLLLSKDNDGDK